MKKIFFLFIFVGALSACVNVVSSPNNMPAPTASIYDFKLQSIEGKTIDFSSFKGKKLLIVNTASECGYTPQYAGLQELHAKYGDKIQVIGFPCNDFGGQEPGANSEIQSFCSKNYGVTFQMMEKVSVKGENTAPIYKWLTDPALNGWNSEKPNWNFCKYLINEEGKLTNFFNSAVKPLSDDIIKKL
jgi:glutathione peroxidase